MITPITYANLLSPVNMPAVRRALVERYKWFVHVAPACALDGIRRDGLLANRDVAPPTETGRIDGRILCFHPLGAERCPEPSYSKLSPPLGEGPPELVCFAVDSASLPEEVSIDWSYELNLVKARVLESASLNVGELAVRIAHEWGSIASYVGVGVDRLKVFCPGDPPADPLGWRPFRSVLDTQIYRFKLGIS
jgi:hypothetical protein